MKKILAIALILTTVSNFPVSASVVHKVIKVIDGATVYVDFNDNGIANETLWLIARRSTWLGLLRKRVF